MFYASQGAWRSVEEMGDCVTQLEYLQHVAYLRRRGPREQAVLDAAKKGRR